MEKKRQFKKRAMMAVGAIKDIIDSNQAEDDTAIFIAKKFGVSRNVLQAAFKQQYGITIRDYKLRVRMEFSRLLLEQGKDIKQVSLEVRYTAQSSFTSAFKRYYGIAPTEMINGHGHTFMTLGKRSKI